MATPQLNAGAALSYPTHDIRVNHAGVVTGAFLAGVHLVWAALVAAGLAQPLLDFMYWMHFIKPVFVVEPFEAMRALMLIAMTAVIGYLIGAVFAYLWNRMHH